MQRQVLVVSDPPHGKVDSDAAAAIMGLNVADTLPKIAFPAPEVLKASDPDRAAEVAQALRETGMSVALIDGHELAKVPWPGPVRSFGFADDGLVARTVSDEVGIPYDVPVLGVHCKPPPDFAVLRLDESGDELGPDADGLEIAQSIEWLPILDLYYRRGENVQRVSIVQGVTDLSGVGDGTSAAAAECESRFERIELDTRLEDVRPRQRFIAGDAGFDIDMRKLYSFGTLLLRQALDSISPELGDVPQYELGSRLAYVLSRHRAASPREG